MHDVVVFVGDRRRGRGEHYTMIHGRDEVAIDVERRRRRHDETRNESEGSYYAWQ
jgi:hypothetical protein